MNLLEIQANLQSLGFDPGRIDGLWGPKTEAAIEAALTHFGVKLLTTSQKRLMLAAEQLIMREVAKIAVGAIDGLAGPMTRYAQQIWDAGIWRDVLMKEVPGDERFPAPVQNTWPKQSELSAVLGKVGTNLVRLALPYPMRLAWDLGNEITGFMIHEKVAESAGRVLDRVLDHYGLEEIKQLRLDRFGGCFNVRPMRGGTKPSTHSWGIAIDFDPENNQLRWGRDKAKLARPEYDKFWDLWTEEGWLSLGKARNFDWMHLQAARI